MTGGPGGSAEGSATIPDCVELAQALVRHASLNPPGEERACIDHLARLLSQAGLEVESHDFAPGRPSLIARARGTEPDVPGLCFTGHVDVVPLGAGAWSVPPFDGLIRDGRLYGRGSSDMKSGIAAFVVATLRALADGPLRRGITLVITSGEETGCEGAFHLARLGVLPPAALLVVAEPTANRPIVAHKGSLRLVVTASGTSAHSSMPELGDNAIEKVADWIGRLARHRFDVIRHPLLGTTTVAVTTITGGANINSIPDRASFTVDIRTVPGHSHAALLSEIGALLGADAEIRTVTDFAGYSTDPDDPALAPLLQALAGRPGEPPVPAGAPYFTDASALVPALGDVPTVVIGPGETAQAHRTDEHCVVERIREATELYADLIRRLCR